MLYTPHRNLVITAAFPLATLATLAILAALGCAAGGSLPGGPMEFVPDDSYEVNVLNVRELLGGDAGDELADQLESEWEDDLDGIGIDLDDLTTLVIAFGRDGRLVVLEGEIDFDDVRDELDDDRYQGYEIWEEGYGFVGSAALLEDSGHLLLGDADAVEGALRVLDRGSGSLVHDADNDLGRVLERAEDGWAVYAVEDCEISEVRGCLAVATVFRKGNEAFLIEVSMTVLFRNERTAESEMDDLEDELEDALPREFDIEEVRQDGEFVIVTTSVDEDDWEALYFR